MGGETMIATTDVMGRDIQVWEDASGTIRADLFDWLVPMGGRPTNGHAFYFRWVWEIGALIFLRSAPQIISRHATS
ncbi:MAG TPA: hypothetical protein PLB88_10840 [Thermoanaerobaculaceae bacterium]|nr:hypothetical protein [Thermoanaerobaculaceae bacterium]